MTDVAIVEQLVTGVPVKLASGEVMVCKPFTLKLARELDLLAQQSSDATKTTAERARARTELLASFTKAYPELEEHISAGDVFALLPDFFWGETGAQVLSPRTGNGNGATTPATTAAAPTP